ncbi:ubiquitin [Nitzschia inconspicua]|uniref:Ubiquitin n=1 Tax=Nitzschia inconspicua TaxID=303405 RepID=A0A9K3K5I8_9STRA|nr:ubiquitin [Nitzschia inconspicua]
MSSDHLTSYTSSTSPRTPRRSPKTTKNLSNNKSPKKVMKSPSFTPKGWKRNNLSSSTKSQRRRPNDVWFYPPNFNADYIGSDAEKLPSYFTQRGVWTYPIVKRNVAEIAPEATGWLGMGETVKIEKLDVAGTWKMLYKQGAQEDDAPKGPVCLSQKLKRRVEDQEGIAVDDQLLSLNGKILDDLSILKDCGVGHEQLLCLEAMSIQVRDSFRSSENLYTLDCGLVSPSSTIEEIKMLLNDVHNLPPPEYLRLRYRDSLLDEDSNTLKNYDIPHKAILDLEPLGLTVETPKGTSISLQLHPTDTIQRVKELVEEKENVPVSEQHLLFEGTTLKDSKTLVESDIHDGDTLILGGMQVHIQHFNGHTITLDVTSTTTIDQIKEMIQDIEGTPIDQQFLSLGSKHLKDEGRTLSSYNIKHGSTLKLEKMKIFIQSPTGKFPLHVSPVTTMEELKHMIVEKTSIAPRNQVIHFRDSTIGDDNQATLSDCGIQHRDTLQVEDTGAKDDPAYMVQDGKFLETRHPL